MFVLFELGLRLDELDDIDLQSFKFSLSSILDILLVLLISIISIAIVIAIVAAFPFAASAAIGERYRIRNAVFYLTIGAVTGMLSWPIFDWIAAPRSVYPQAFLTGYAEIDVPILAVCGAVGGIAYWWKAGRNAGAT